MRMYQKSCLTWYVQCGLKLPRNIGLTIQQFFNILDRISSSHYTNTASYSTDDYTYCGYFLGHWLISHPSTPQATFTTCMFAIFVSSEAIFLRHPSNNSTSSTNDVNNRCIYMCSHIFCTNTKHAGSEV